MKIPLKQNLEVAQKVLDKIQKIGTYDSEMMWVECYSNGREQGYAIFRAPSKNAPARYIMFSEHRSSDSIVVYDNGDQSPNMQGNTPSEEAYKNAKMFAHDEVLEAACYIISLVGVPSFDAKTNFEKWAEKL